MNRNAARRHRSLFPLSAHECWLHFCNHPTMAGCVDLAIIPNHSPAFIRRNASVLGLRFERGEGFHEEGFDGFVGGGLGRGQDCRGMEVDISGFVVGIRFDVRSSEVSPLGSKPPFHYVWRLGDVFVYNFASQVDAVAEIFRCIHFYRVDAVIPRVFLKVFVF